MLPLRILLMITVPTPKNRNPTCTYAIVEAYPAGRGGPQSNERVLVHEKYVRVPAFDSHFETNT